ncbi:GNAT family N-acetyltransferase [Kribbella sp. NBC_00382]|uniref:GNAT family N-acetyltransferase n=1 Tax=Kribbella sp. NBC_00382 TaxID=2975967 RepID=UPI002E1B3B6C
MTSPDQLVSGELLDVSIELVEVGPDDAAVVRSVYVWIWEPLKAHGRLEWSDEEWVAELSHPAIRTWIARLEGETAGVVELELSADGEVGIVVFGLVPAYQGRGLGAAFLTAATQLAWQLGRPTKRVWLQTSSDDHAHALGNYQSRGFRVFSAEPQ